MRPLVSLVFTVIFLFPSGIQAKGQIDCKSLEEIFHHKAETKNDVCSISIPRKNIKVTSMGKNISNELVGLSFNVRFEKVDGQAVAMGEFCLLENEVEPVIDEIRKGKLEVTAVHNHWLEESPRLIFLHFQGVGNENELAKSVERAIKRTKG